jgi:Co/Zn/Cd efflux system component
MKKTPIKMLATKVAMFGVAAFISFFSLGASVIIFWRSIEIVLNLDYTKNEQYVIVGIIGFVLMWLCSLAASSTESIIEKQLIKEQNNNGI